MSEPIPESIPTSVSRRNQRPLKKRLINAPASTLQANQIGALFSHPDVEVHIPKSASGASAKSAVGPPPEIVQNVQGSSAGAGSGEFHVYKASRRREYERVREMETVLEKEKDTEVWERERREQKARDEESTRRKREKRERKKVRNGAAVKGAGVKGMVDSMAYKGTEEKNGERSPRQKSNEQINEARVKPRVNLPAPRQNEAVDEKAESTTAVEEPIGLIIHDDD